MTVKVERHGKRIVLTSDRKLKKLDKSIPGANFSASKDHWTFPLNMETCNLLRAKFKSELELGPEITAWARARKRKDKTMRRLGKAVSADLPGLWLSKNPKLFKAVTQGRPYQSVGARFISEGRRVIVADTVGLGKTAQTLAGIMESQLPGPYLIVCPKTPVETVWRPEVERWLPNHSVWTCPEGRGRRKAILDLFLHDDNEWGTAFVVVNQDMLRTRAYWVCQTKVEIEGEAKPEKCLHQTLVKGGTKKLNCGHDHKKTKIVYEHEYPELFEVEWSAVVADESDKSLLKKVKIPTQTRRGMEMLRVREDGIKIAQSATPWRSRPHLLWSTLNWLYPEEYSSFWAWAESLYEMEEGHGDARVIGALDPDREKLLHKTLSGVMIRRTKQEVSPHLPRRMYMGQEFYPEVEGSPVGVWLDMSPEQERAYKSMQEDAWAEISGGEIAAIGSLAEITRLQQFASCSREIREGKVGPVLPSNKFDYLVQMLIELGMPDDPQTKVAVVSRETQLLELFARELKSQHKIDSVMLTGKVSKQKRTEAVNGFKSMDAGPYVMFMNTKAGGSAITLDAADIMVFLDETHVADDQEQCEGRIDNRRPEEKIVQRMFYYLRSKGTVEVGIALVNADTSAEDRRLLDERRGVQWSRDVMEATFRQNKTSG